MIEKIFEIIFQFIIEFIRFVVFLILYNIVAFCIGYIILKVVTLWRYPGREMSERDKNVVCNTGIIVPFFLYLALFITNAYIL